MLSTSTQEQVPTLAEYQHTKFSVLAHFQKHGLLIWQNGNTRSHSYSRNDTVTSGPAEPNALCWAVSASLSRQLKIADAKLLIGIAYEKLMHQNALVLSLLLFL